MHNPPQNQLTVLPQQEEQAIREVNRIITTMAVPKELNGRPQDIHSIVNIAMKMGIPTEMALSSVHVIHGKVAFDAKFLIAVANRSGHLDRPLYHVYDETRTQWCYAVGVINGMEYRGPTVTTQMAKEERWGGKWKTIPELMLAYRSSAFFIRTIIPDVLMGAEFSDELKDIQAHHQQQHNAQDQQSVDDMNGYVTAEIYDEQ